MRVTSTGSDASHALHCAPFPWTQALRTGLHHDSLDSPRQGGVSTHEALSRPVLDLDWHWQAPKGAMAGNQITFGRRETSRHSSSWSARSRSFKKNRKIAKKTSFSTVGPLPGPRPTCRGRPPGTPSRGLYGLSLEKAKPPQTFTSPLWGRFLEPDPPAEGDVQALQLVAALGQRTHRGAPHGRDPVGDQGGQ